MLFRNRYLFAIFSSFALPCLQASEEADRIRKEKEREVYWDNAIADYKVEKYKDQFSADKVRLEKEMDEVADWHHKTKELAAEWEHKPVFGVYAHASTLNHAEITPVLRGFCSELEAARNRILARHRESQAASEFLLENVGYSQEVLRHIISFLVYGPDSRRGNIAASIVERFLQLEAFNSEVSELNSAMVAGARFVNYFNELWRRSSVEAARERLAQAVAWINNNHRILGNRDLRILGDSCLGLPGGVMLENLVMTLSSLPEQLENLNKFFSFLNKEDVAELLDEGRRDRVELVVQLYSLIIEDLNDVCSTVHKHLSDLRSELRKQVACSGLVEVMHTGIIAVHDGQLVAAALSGNNSKDKKATSKPQREIVLPADTDSSSLTVGFSGEFIGLAYRLVVNSLKSLLDAWKTARLLAK